MDRQMFIYIDRQIFREREKERNGQIDKQIDRQIDYTFSLQGKMY